MEGAESDSDSGESLYEISLNKFVRKDQISDKDFKTLGVKCSACGRQINNNSEKEIRKHRKLSVITCKECYEFYGSSEFSQDESGYKYCTWCGNGGKLIMCDHCPNCFCSACIRRNFGRAEVSKTTKKGWKCYMCNAKCLKPKRKFCDLIMSFKDKTTIKKDKTTIKKDKTTIKKSKNIIKKDKKTPLTTKTDISKQWLKSAFGESEEACEVFCKKMTKLRLIGINKKKSLKHVVKKMEEVIKEHKTALKDIINTVNQNYLSHIERQRAAELESKSNIETVDISSSSDDEKNGHADLDCIIEDDVVKESQNGQMSEESFSPNETESVSQRVNKRKRLAADTNLKSNKKRNMEHSANDSGNKISDILAKEPTEKSTEKDDKSESQKVDVSCSEESNNDSDNKPLTHIVSKRKRSAVDTNLKNNKKNMEHTGSDSDNKISDIPAKEPSEKSAEMDDKSKSQKVDVSSAKESDHDLDSDKPLIHTVNKRKKSSADTNLKRNRKHNSNDSGNEISDTLVKEPTEKSSEIRDKSNNHKVNVSCSEKSNSDSDSGNKIRDIPVKEPTEKSSEMDDKSKNQKVNASCSEESNHDSDNDKPLVHTVNKRKKSAADANLKRNKKRNRKHNSNDSGNEISDTLVKEPTEKSSEICDKSNNHKVNVSCSEESNSHSDNDKPLTHIVSKRKKLSPDTNLTSNKKGNLEQSDSDSVIKISDIPVKEPTEKSSEVNDKTKNPDIDISFSEESNSDFDVDKPDVDQLVEVVDKQVESEMPESVNGKLDPDNDSKLKFEPKVELIRCDHLLKEGEATMLISEASDMEDKLDKLMDSLCKFSRKKYVKKKSKVQKAKQRSSPLKSKNCAETE